MRATIVIRSPTIRPAQSNPEIPPITTPKRGGREDQSEQQTPVTEKTMALSLQRLGEAVESGQRMDEHQDIASQGPTRKI